MTESKILYKQILKSTTLFGGVQIFNIIISIFRSKAIAIFIGPAGMGITGLLSSTINVIYSLTSLGLDTSGVKYISQANTEIDKSIVAKIIVVLRQLMWLTGIIGSLITIIFSTSLSQLTFGNDQYTWAFVWLSSALLLKNILSFHYATLQGLGRLRYLAKANFYGSFFALLITVPFYYFLGIEAIVPTMIISSLLAVLISRFYTSKLDIEKIHIPRKAILKEGKSLIHLGIMLSISGFITTTFAYFLQIYISYNTGIDDVGFYIAGTTILNSYVGIVFTSMSTDYYPRLSAIIHNDREVRLVVSHQAHIALLIITPIICLFIPLAPIITKLLYSSQFESIVPMITYGITGMLFRSVSWSMGYILLAKGDSKMFIRTSLGFNSLFLIMNIIAFYFLGITGLGVSFTIYFFLHFLSLKIITRNSYNFDFEKEFYKIFCICIVLCFSALLVKLIGYVLLKNFISIIIVIIAVLFSLYSLNKKIDLLEQIKKIMKK